MKKILVLSLLFVLIITLIPGTAAYASDDIRVLVNGSYIAFTAQQPIIVDGSTLVPLRGVFDALGFDVVWEAENQTVTLTAPDATKFSFKIGERAISVNSTTLLPRLQTIHMSVSAQIVNGSTLIPLRAVAETIGAEVNWNEQQRLITIIYDGRHNLSDNLSLITISTDGTTSSTRNNYMTGWDVRVPAVQTFVDSGGVISVMNLDNSVIHVFRPNGELMQSIKLHRELKEIGAFTRDREGNYYVFFAQDASEGAFNDRNMVLVKYSPNGSKLDEYRLSAQTHDEKWASGYSGVMRPFANGTCRIEVSGDMIAVYFGRIQFRGRDGQNHQASYGFILNKNTFERLSGRNMLTMPSAGHSWNQFILPVEGGFVFADHGDHGPRSFVFERVRSRGTNNQAEAFRFKGGMNQSGSVAYQNTFAEMGGLSKTSSGYIFIGASEKSNVIQSAHNDSRNLFVLTIAESFSTVSSPVWLTNYSDKEAQNVVAPKVVSIGINRHLILWEEYNTAARQVSATYMMVIDDSGNAVVPAQKLSGAQLNGYDTLRFNPDTDQVIWAVSHGDEIILYFLKPL